MDYREVPDSHRTAYREILHYAFSADSGPELDDEERTQPDTLHRRGLYDRPASDRVAADDSLSADDLRTVCGWFDFTARVRGGRHRLAGVTAVASPPESRRQGLVSTMFDGLLEELRDDGVHFSVLYPFEFSFYRRFGWALANHYERTTVPPDELSSVAADPAGRFRRLAPDDWAEMADVLAAAADHPLAVERTEGWWRHRTFRGWETDPYVYGWERDGTLRGYVVYTVQSDGDETTLAASELVAADREALTQLYRFLRDHDSQVDSVRLSTPVGSDLLETLEDPRAAEVTRRPGAMVRLVDVGAALESLSYPADANAGVVLDVTDDRCGWNDRTLALTVADGRATCRTTDATPDVALDVGSLSQLVVGTLSASTLAAYGDLTPNDPDATATLDSLFPETDPAPYVREFF